jgi:hypothetical protein
MASVFQPSPPTDIQHKPARGSMKITSIDADGTGTATMSINFVGHFNPQVSQNGQIMSLVEISDTINYDVGVAVKQ